ncbi:exodeoxyribonuclease VII large subunit [Sulfitobacter aestuariivivens]|uniref:Exodeoxyribonuclease 7 large subunit n=1 Tax=Sulfitobacter aestuariivivens TaxID=2766981 RepID=A0A927D3T1_9RHOB|nr:exodeoxyribonuclease VII large subunit [Sulfitobacter aestuariivivens]MBD3663763.1 exodeoxyribonuclease VII large subunit [Sulfitobacter aestuariivivens]
MDLLDDPQPGSNTPEFTVSEIAGSVKKLVEAELGWVRIKGEVGRVVQARSGHLYFDLKDDRSVLSCMTWKGQIPALGMIPEEGTEVVAEGKMTASGFQSKFALNAQRLTIAGEGALMALLEKRKKALAAEGLFDESRKKPLPYLPDIIGVVTSLQGVVIRDIMHRLRDRFPRKVLVWPVAVQGQACAPEVARAIDGFNAMSPGGALPRPDLIIVARGGGSVEDLWGFNEEIVARAAAASDIPLISAVGHETDTTLIDFVSDKRAPTPTAAAELAVPVRHELAAGLEGQGARMGQLLSQGLSRRDQRLRDMARALPRPDALLDTPRQRLDRAVEKLGPSLMTGVQRRRVRLSDVSGLLRPATLSRRVAEGQRAVSGLGTRLSPALERSVSRRRDALAAISRRFRPDTLASESARQRQRFEDLTARLSAAGARQIDSWQKQIEARGRVLNTLGYEATLERGFAVVRSEGRVVTSAKVAKKAGALEIQFADGRMDVAGGKVATAPSKKRGNPPDQGSLF